MNINHPRRSSLDLAVRSLAGLLEWAKGNRGRRDVNPYCVPEVKAGLRALSDITAAPGNWMDVDTAGISAGRYHLPPVQPSPDWRAIAARLASALGGVSYHAGRLPKDVTASAAAALAAFNDARSQ